ncbi:hypothetical protein BZA05DRAFT_387867 [Tricharina praecox]|uniref:uncharacterized protein n=1 Tax=Tricharina praecox TaxID=43433 RepID=UPI0022210020|nr:uncharacterized protein BZA05DRAFT_387867 [Tricharina praecox]KAI5856247.1 hypothetical protein BZA05DRAFT_387867 [Tricharina praecox]
MSKTIHRQIGRFQSRSADDASVSMIMKEVDDMDLFLGKLLEHTKTWRDSWSDILVNQTRLADSFHDVYQTIPRTGDSTIPPEPTPPEIMRRVALLHTSYNELKDDMLDEVAKVETMLVQPLGECRAMLKPIKKAVEKREHKKLDYERFAKATETLKLKKAKTDKDYGALQKSEAELERAKNAYSIADDSIRESVPPLLAGITAFLPLVVEIAVQVQFTLLQHSYSQLYHYATENGFTDPDSAVVVSEWEELFLPVKQQVESELRLILKGKAVTLPMNYTPDKGVLSKLPRVPLGKGKAPPPPPPTAAIAADGGRPPPSRGNENSRPGITKPKSSTSLSSRYSRDERDHSPPPPMPGARPSIGGGPKIGRSASLRDESPPPPLPGPRPGSNGVDRPRIGSYGGSYGGGSVTPTPLAGLRPTALTVPSSRGSVRSLSPTSPSPESARTGRTLSPRIPSSGGRSPSPSQLVSIVAGKKKPPPPPPKKKFAGPKEVWVKAIFTFEGQDRGDLSFSEGERIKVLKKTDNIDDWWEGECNGRKGQFPANYCEPTV